MFVTGGVADLRPRVSLARRSRGRITPNSLYAIAA